MKQFLPYYERELGFYRRASREFARQFPKLANALLIAGETSEDPHIERVIQACAFLNARTAKRLDDDYRKFTESLLQVMYPDYLRPFPSCSIAQVDYRGVEGSLMSGVTTIARGTVMDTIEHANVICQFRSAYDVAIAPVALTEARFEPVIHAPATARVPVDTSSCIHIVIESLTPGLSLAALDLPRLRVFIDGEPGFCAALRDALFMRVAHAYVEAGTSGNWSALEQLPFSAAGFAAEDALIPWKASSHPAYRLLTEYFSFPEKFNFFDIELAALIPYLPPECRRLSLHLTIPGARAEPDFERRLQPLSSKNMLLGCTPVINLFKQSASPITLTHTAIDYPLVANARQAYASEVYSIDSVHMLRDAPQGSVLTQFRPYYSLRHERGDSGKGHYWLTRREEAMALHSPGHELYIAFIDIDFNPVACGTSTVSLELTCTNRDLPARLGYGLPGGDLALEGGAGGYPLRLLRKPNAPYRFTSDKQAHWRLISNLSLNHNSLAQKNLEAFTELLRLYDLPQSPISQRQIDGVMGLEHQAARAWIKDRHGGGRVHGIEVRLTLDEEAFTGSGIHVFAQVIEHFLGLYVHINSFTRLVILSSKTGKELLRCRPRNGDLNLV
jgi:type VI secretion system protein ImpG